MHSFVQSPFEAAGTYFQLERQRDKQGKRKTKIYLKSRDTVPLDTLAFHCALLQWKCYEGRCYFSKSFKCKGLVSVHTTLCCEIMSEEIWGERKWERVPGFAERCQYGLSKTGIILAVKESFQWTQSLISSIQVQPIYSTYTQSWEVFQWGTCTFSLDCCNNFLSGFLAPRSPFSNPVFTYSQRSFFKRVSLYWSHFFLLKKIILLNVNCRQHAFLS